MNIDEIKELSKALHVGEETTKGFIMMPSLKGFDLFEIDKSRLKLYMQLESLHRKAQADLTTQPKGKE